MKRKGIFTTLILMLVFSIFATGCVIDDSPSEMRFSDANQVDILVFRCGDAYLTHEKENLDWLVPHGDIPAEIDLEDGEFAYVNADISRVTGGSSFYTGNPQFKKINSFQKVTFEELVNNGELTAYDPATNTFRQMGYYASGNVTYCIARHNGTYYVYENSVCTGVYHTKADMESALGMNSATAPAAETTTAESVESSAITETVTGDPEAIQKYVEEMVVDYGSYGEDADARVDELLNELSSEDTNAGIRWTRIMDLWRSESLGEPLNYDVLPDGLPDTDELCIVVLGFQLNPDGSMRDELINRLTVAYNSAVKYPNSYIVCTGGGTASENDSATEAGRMAEWLIDQGIDEDRIIVEDDSLTTAQNAIYTYDILTSDYPSVKYIAIVSSDYHIATGELLFSAEAILRSDVPGEERIQVISNASWDAPSGYLSPMFQAGALIELSGDVKTAFDIYYDNYDIHELPPID